MNVTLRFQSTGVVPGNARPAMLRGPSLTIGRSQQNDLVLPDPDRSVSGSHCVIENHQGTIFVVDLSTNGTFLNYSKTPLGRSPTALNDGDILSIGPYELIVEMVDEVYGSDLPPPVEMGGASHGRANRAPNPLDLLDDSPPGTDFLDSLLGDPKGPTGPRKLKMGSMDPDALLPPLGDDDDSLLGTSRATPAAPAMQDHSTSVSDSFRPQVASRNVIPDDWEDDFLSPSPAQRDPFGSASFATPSFPPAPTYDAAPSTAAVIPDDIFDDFLTPLTPDEPAQAAEPEPVGEAAAPVADAEPVVAEVPSAEPEPVSVPVLVPETARAPEPVVVPPPAAEPADIFADIFADSPAPEIEAPDDQVAATNFDPFEEAEVETPAPPAYTPPVAPAAPPAYQAPAAATTSGSNDSAAVRAFLAALGATDVRLTDEELLLTMTRLGGTLKAMITGLREILMTRTSIKSEFRIDQTMITVGKNNPLKFSISPEQAIEAMTKPAVRGYLEADQAAKQALDDLKAHEIAMVTGMEAALKGVLARLDPAVLTTKIETGGGLGGMFRGKKAQYWETYEKMYAEIADQAENDFHDLFSREFAQAYKDQLARLKNG